MKTLTKFLRSNTERFVVPKSVQDVIPIRKVYDDGVFMVDKNKFSKTFKFTDINYAVADDDDKMNILEEYADFLSALDSGMTTKITVNTRRLTRSDFERDILIPDADDGLDMYRHEYNRIILEKAAGLNSMIQDKYITLTVDKRSVEEARSYFSRVIGELSLRLSKLGCKCSEPTLEERLRVFHDFFRLEESGTFRFNVKEKRRRGHNFKDSICPDSFEFYSDYFRIGDRFGRVMFLKEYGSYIKDSIASDLTALQRNLMMSIDIIPVPISEALKEAENRLLGVETEIANWQRRQNQFDNFGREVSSQTHTAGGEDLGASHYDYTAGEVDSTGSNVKKINRLTNTHSVGKNVPNYIYNNNFENSEQWSNASWFYDATFTGSYSTDERMYGQRSYKISVSSYENTGAGRAYQDISGLTAGKTYTLSGYVKVTSFSGTETTSGAFIGATFGSTKYFSENVKPVTDENVNNGWRRVSVTFTVPNGYTSARIHIALRSATGTAYFDALQLTEGETPVSFNLVDNENFERNAGFSAVGWNSGNLTLGYGMDGENSDGIAHDGQKCFRIAGDPTIQKELWQRVSVSGSESDCYILSGWGKGNSVNLSSDRKFEISATVSYTNGTSRSLGAVQFNPAVTSWQFVSKALSLSDQNANTDLTPQYIYIQLRYHYQGNAAYFDNISLVKEPSSSYTYDNDGNLVSVSANAQKNSTMEYNSDNQLTKIIDPKGGTYEYTYVDGSKNIVKTAKTQQGAVYTYDYDSRGSVTQLEGEVTVDNQTLKNKSQQSITYPTSSSSSYTVTTSDSRGINSSSEYNAKTGTLSNTTDNNNVTTSYTYQTGNNLLSSVSKNGSTVSYTYSADNKRLSSVSSSTSGYSFSYNSFGERTATNVGNQALAAYTYNAGGTLTRMTYGNGDYVDYSYDNFGNVRERSQNGTVTYRAYADNTGAVTREVDESNNVEYNYLYDSTDRLVSKKASYISAASGARSFKSSFSYDYDLNNNVTKFSVLTAKGPITTDYTYGLDNLPLTATFQSGKVLTNTFDKLGRLTKTNLNTNSNIETTYTYLASGYEGDYTTNFVETETNGVFTYKYSYDEKGNILKLYRKNLNGNFVVAERYTYNALDELTQVNYYGLQKRCVYTYDAGGNILSEKVYDTSVSNTVPESTVLYEYGDNNWKDKLTSYGGSAITYDAIGNPSSYRGMTLTWQNGRQLASSSDGSTVTNYTYGADGMRMTKKVGSSTTYYQYFNGLLIQEIKGTKILDYSYDANGQIYAVRYRTNANDEGTYYYYAHNTRGDIVGIYNADGSLHAKYSYDVWGNPLSVTDASNAAITSQTDIANLQSFRYRGYYYDSNSGFYYLQSRYYDPVTHRFLNADGLVSTGTGVLGYNMFAYCENNPVNCSDYDGYRFDDSFGGGGGIAVPISYGSGGGSYIGYTVLGTTAAIIGLVSTNSTAAMRQEMFAYRRQKAKERIKDIDVVNTTPTENRKQAYFPADPYSFNPNGLIPKYYPGSYNGAFIKWFEPDTNVAIFEWDEDFEKGPHYHVMIIEWDSQHLDDHHYHAGDSVPEPWNTMYFND